ncbi:MAG: YicC/YloC family endoribonuclease [Marinagarivorans sp.]|nr:YicC/YloC family endoribonuclease [Marinagarivorans sp.]
MTHSMTGFARIEEEYLWGRLSCEIRSVNHRYLESSIRLPESLRAAELNFRDLIKNTLSRGKVEVSLYLKQEQGAGCEINPQALQDLMQLLAGINAQVPNVAAVNSFEILRWPGIVQEQTLDNEALTVAAFALLQKTLNRLQQSRAREGAGLAESIRERLHTIAQHLATLRAQLPELIATQQERLQQKLVALQVDIDQDRLAQELVIIAQKTDVAEELDRLDNHIEETQRTLSQAEPIGRRLDFLMQEFNREANTLGSKAIANGVTQIAVELKVLIEQMREQVQNIE